MTEGLLRGLLGNVVADCCSGSHKTTRRAKAPAEQSRMLDLVQAALAQQPWNQGEL
ncbi:hypothetical protein [Streptomyces sp. MBT53]|uniref:hypothetical protein n=1 Tax=Streptomyces sp. MBT53 TaxID=1488384 RepID=UPI001912431D|nr:hypothetical protein [Streptomyces sp. MBT53]MBK6018813.1 hypothetical protein [Streptomyces sp. MBT53]